MSDIAGGDSPRVRITYEVQTGEGTEVRELPFVIGVLADLEGRPEQTIRLKDKRFVRLGADNFEHVLEVRSPALKLTVDCKLLDAPQQLAVELRFRTFSDFEPAAVAAQIPCLRSLLDLRWQLSDLRGSILASDRLDRTIQEILLRHTTEQRNDPERWDAEIESILERGLAGRLDVNTG